MSLFILGNKRYQKLFIVFATIIIIYFSFSYILKNDFQNHQNVNYNDINNDNDYDNDNDNNEYFDIIDDGNNNRIENKIVKISNSMDNDIYNYSVILCEERPTVPLESFKGFKLSCPAEYELSINSSFFGRRNNDTITCNPDKNSDSWVSEDSPYFVNDDEICYVDPTEKLKKLCNGKKRCRVVPTTSIYSDSCRKRNKYMEINYSCIPFTEKNDPRFAVVMFSDSSLTKLGSIHENAINDFRNYTKNHNYEFFLNTNVYVSERPIYYMKLYTLVEYIIKGLKEETYDWILWVDSDVVLANPTIELNAFIPPQDQDEVDFIITADHNGINAGIFLIKVSEWSLSFMMRAISYSYFNKDEFLRFADQSAIKIVLEKDHEENHYVVAPQTWFNSYKCQEPENTSCYIKGDFIVHFAGNKNKDGSAIKFRNRIKDNNEWNARTTEEMREITLAYYRLPKEQRLHLFKK